MQTPLSRRAFLRLSSAAIVTVSTNQWRAAHLLRSPKAVLFYGRVIFVYATIYRRPSIHAATTRIHPQETILPIYAEVESADTGPSRQHWYETDGGYVYSTNVQPVNDRSNAPAEIFLGQAQLGEVTVPHVDALAAPGVGARLVYRLYYGTTHWIQQSVADETGKIWYQLLDDRASAAYFVPGVSMRLIAPDELRPLSSNIADKRIQIDTTQETITAIEAGREVFSTRISSGGSFGAGKDFRTPLGKYRIYHKRPSRHMAAGDGAADDAYDLPGVPWVSYFNGGIAIHGTFWHNDFGHPWSHGCINLRSQDAKWFFRWSTPVVPFGQDELAGPGTLVTVF